MGIPTLLKLIDPHTTRPAHRKICGCVPKFESVVILACNPDRRTREISEAHRIAQPPPRYGSTPSNARFDEDAAYLECDVMCNLYAQHARVFHFASGSSVYGVSVDVRINFYVGHEFGARAPVPPSSHFLASVAFPVCKQGSANSHTALKTVPRQNSTRFVTLAADQVLLYLRIAHR